MDDGAKQDKGGDYGESDIEAEAMTDAASGSGPAGTPPTPASGAPPAAGTTETDVVANRRDVVERKP